jgi:hypothetical protein
MRIPDLQFIQFNYDFTTKHCETVKKKNAKGKKCSYLKINFNYQKFLITSNLLKCKNIRINYPTAWYTQPATA